MSDAAEVIRVPAEHLGRPVVFYDGVCGMCNRLTQVVLLIDRRERVLFAPLQSDAARALVTPHGVDPDALDTFVLLRAYGTPRERVSTRSEAVFDLAYELGGAYRVLSWLRVLPRVLTDAVYRAVARSRYAVFGKHDACPIPKPEERRRFIDLA